MIGLLAKIIPLDLASMLSPGIFAMALFLLGSKYHPKIRTLALFLGSLLVGIGITIFGFALGFAAPTGIAHNNITGTIDVFLGILFIVFGIGALKMKERKIKPQHKQDHQIIKWLIIGFAATTTNFDALFLNFTAAKEVSGSLTTPEFGKLILAAVNLFFFTLPITLPLIIYLIFPRMAGRTLPKLNEYVTRYSKYIMFVLFIIFGIYLTYRGIIYLK